MVKRNIQYLRELRGISVRDLALRTNIAFPSVSRIENGNDTRWSSVVKLADFFGVSTDYLMGRSNTYNFLEEGEFSKEEIELAIKFIREVRKMQHTPQTFEGISHSSSDSHS